ncbi:MAG: very short patch repair endonuclease [Ferruginibacter sp.]|nr:very short patch repair endonuclease [Ferruginibacter sp.]
MKKIRSSNTTPELLLRKELWNLGYRYRLNVSKLKGKPDIVFNKFKLVVFVDGEFWHGYEWQKKKPKIKANREYWVKKIERNIERDKENTKSLLAMGYVVLRFWEHEIKSDLSKCVKKIVAQIIKAAQ